MSPTLDCGVPEWLTAVAAVLLMLAVFTFRRYLVEGSRVSASRANRQRTTIVGRISAIALCGRVDRQQPLGERDLQMLDPGLRGRIARVVHNLLDLS